MNERFTKVLPDGRSSLWRLGQSKEPIPSHLRLPLHSTIFLYKILPETNPGPFYFHKQEPYTRRSFRIRRESVALPPRVIISLRSTMKHAFLFTRDEPCELLYVPQPWTSTVPNHCHIREGKSIFDGGRCTRAYVRSPFHVIRAVAQTIVCTRPIFKSL